MDKTAIHLFRRDLRLSDNTALNHALGEAETVLPIFILNPRQFRNNQYFSSNAFQFMVESLEELDRELRTKGSKLTILIGDPVPLIEQLFEQTGARKLYFNRDYTPFSIERDANLTDSFNTHVYDDVLLHPPGSILKSDSTPYTVFTPFYKTASGFSVPEPETVYHGKFYNKHIEGSISPSDIEMTVNPHLAAKGGRKEGLKLLKKTINIRNYGHDRDYPAKDGTTRLSPHLKFGSLSVREVYHALVKMDQELIRELHWRDFFTHIAFFYPHVFGNAFKEQYTDIQWSNDIDLFTAWCSGRTGFPIVDAGIRELNKTGFMHNRVRMITASFLVKDLHIDWRWGEKYFAQRLVDYDPSVNNGNWQWAASTGCDAQPYFRIFNPWRQQERFDPDCDYIRKWVPELATYSSKEIHSHVNTHLSGYQTPIIDHGTESRIAKDLFKEASQKN